MVAAGIVRRQRATTKSLGFMTFSLRLRSPGTTLFYSRKGTEFEGGGRRKLGQWWKSPERPETALACMGFPSAALRVCDFFEAAKNRGCKQSVYDDQLAENSKKSQTLRAGLRVARNDKIEGSFVSLAS